MRVDERHREPLTQSVRPTAGFRLRANKPVPIEIEQVVIRAPARPGLVVLGGQPVGVCNQALGHFEVMNKAVAAVGVLQRIDNHDRIAHDGRNARIAARGEQVIRSQHRGFRGRDLVAVHAVGQPGNRRLTGDDLARLRGIRCSRIRQSPHIGLDLVNSRNVFRCGNNHVK